MAVGDDNIADFTFDNYAALKLSRNIRRGKLALFRTPQISIVLQPRCVSSTRLSCPSPNGSSAGLDEILPQVLKDLPAMSNGQTGLNFLRALTNLVNVISNFDCASLVRN